MNIPSIMYRVSLQFYMWDLYAYLRETCVIRFAWLVSLLFMSVSRTLFMNVVYLLPACLPDCFAYTYYIVYSISSIFMCHIWIVGVRYSRKECFCREFVELQNFPYELLDILEKKNKNINVTFTLVKYISFHKISTNI